MSQSQTSPIGIIDSISASGSGQRSAEVLIRLKTGPNDFLSFFLGMPTPDTSETREKFFKLLCEAYEKMWDAKKVKITSHLYNNDQFIDKIEDA